MSKIIDYPEKVLETYDVIEKLLVGKQNRPLVSSNSVKSDVLLYILNELYETTTDFKASPCGGGLEGAL
ncbi:MAG TPA: hypothetical protein DCR40_18145 [Prolixibacteraceae bacterium]|nr:hypothetical protein [Prolixibacteraceae bacterium]